MNIANWYRKEIFRGLLYRIYYSSILSMTECTGKEKQCYQWNEIDNKPNILTNKIVAIMNRDEERDIFDLCAFYNEEFNWGAILSIANKKRL